MLDQYGVKGEDDIYLKELVTLLGKGPTTSTSPCEDTLASESFASSATEENARNMLAKSIVSCHALIKCIQIKTNLTGCNLSAFSILAPLVVYGTL